MTAAPSNSPRDKEIARRAYAIWEQEGRPEGRERDHWSQAERELGAPGDDGSDQTEHYAQEELPEPGAPDPDSTLSEAWAQPGEGVPDPTPAADEQPIAAGPDLEEEAPKSKAKKPVRNRRGARTGP